MTDAIKPLPCPFCHRSAEARDLDTDFPDASCPDSECPGNDYWFPINKWNRRPSPESERVRELEAQVGRMLGAGKALRDAIVYGSREIAFTLAAVEAYDRAVLSTSPAPEKAKCPMCHEPDCSEHEAAIREGRCEKPSLSGPEKR